MKDRILRMLAQGIKAQQIASVVGCSPGYISQLVKDEENVRKITEYKKEYFVDENKDGEVLTNKYNAAENRLLERVMEAAESAELPALTRALEVVGNRQEKRLQRLAMPVGGHSGVNVQVNLTLPSHAALQLPSYQVNENKEVIAIGGRQMAPMSSEGVKNLFEQLAGKGKVQDVIEASESFKVVDISGADF